MIPLKFRASFDKSEMVSGLSNIQQMAGNTGAVMSKGFGAGAAALTSAALAAKSLIDAASEIVDFSTQANIGTEEFQKMGFAFGQSGTKAEGYRNALIKLNSSIEDAVAGSKAMTASFEALGISTESLEGQDTGDVMLMIADAAHDATDKGKAMAAIIDLLGRSGKTMAGTLMEGRDAIVALGESASVVASGSLKLLDREGDMLAATFKKLKAVGMEAVANFLDPTGGQRVRSEQKAMFEETLAKMGEQEVKAESLVEWQQRGIQLGKDKYQKAIEQAAIDDQTIKRLNQENDILLDNARLEQERLDKIKEKNAEIGKGIGAAIKEAEAKAKADLIDKARDELGKRQQGLEGAQGALGQAMDRRVDHIGESADERRQRLRDERKQDRVEGRAERDREAIGDQNRKRRGARPGDARDMADIGKAQKDVKFAAGEVQALVDAIEKLLIKP